MVSPLQDTQKMSKRLAYKLWKIQANNKIIQLRTLDGSISFCNILIKQTINIYLQTSKSPPLSLSMNIVLKAIFPKLTEEQKQITNAPMMELTETVHRQKRGKEYFMTKMFIDNQIQYKWLFPEDLGFVW